MRAVGHSVTNKRLYRIPLSPLVIPVAAAHVRVSLAHNELQSLGIIITVSDFCYEHKRHDTAATLPLIEGSCSKGAQLDFSGSVMRNRPAA